MWLHVVLRKFSHLLYFIYYNFFLSEATCEKQQLHLRWILCNKVLMFITTLGFVCLHFVSVPFPPVIFVYLTFEQYFLLHRSFVAFSMVVYVCKMWCLNFPIYSSVVCELRTFVFVWCFVVNSRTCIRIPACVRVETQAFVFVWSYFILIRLVVVNGVLLQHSFL